MRTLAALALILGSRPAAAHDAFGDLGPFYANLLHPLADPLQALLLAAFAIVLAGQTTETVRPGYAALVAGATLAVVSAALLGPAFESARLGSAFAAGLGLLAVFGVRLSPVPAAVLALAVGIMAGLAADRTASGLRDGLLAALGGAAGVAAVTLLVWSLVDLLKHQIGIIACRVAGSWVAAIGLMVAALPR